MHKIILALFASLCLIGVRVSSADDSLFTAIEQALPSDGVLHIVMDADDIKGQFEIWVNFRSRAVVHISGSRVFLRTATGEYRRGVGANPRTGELRGWHTDRENYSISVLTVPHPIVQAALLLAERSSISEVILEDDGWLVTWGAPRSKVLRASESGPVEVDSQTQIQFKVLRDGQIESWQASELEPIARSGPICFHDYTDAHTLGNMVIPAYVDSSRMRMRRPPEPGVWKLTTVELLDAAPSGIFTSDGALARAVEAAKPMVEAYREDFYWHASPNAPEQEAMPLWDSERNRTRPSWSIALLASGTSVVLIGVIAWWRSRR